MIIIADNQSLTRDALTGYLAGQPLLFAANKAELAQLLAAHPEATVVLDFSLFDFTTPENLLIYIRRFNAAQWLLLSADFTENMLRLLGSETQVSFLTKDCSREEALHAVYQATHGERTVCAAVEAQLREGFHRNDTVANLTAAETEVLSLLAQGLSAKAIAEKRNSSVHTIVTHKKNLFRKLGVSTVYEATKVALRSGIADPVEYYI